MKFKDEKINADYESAQSFDKLRVGKLGVYFPEGLKTRSIPYTDMDRAFIRVHEANGRMCCGTAKFQYYRMVFKKGSKEFADYISENEEAMDNALKLISENAPEVAIGFVND